MQLKQYLEEKFMAISAFFKKKERKQTDKSQRGVEA